MKEKITKIILALFLLFVVVFIITMLSIYKNVNEICDKTIKDFKGNCRESLAKILDSDFYSFREKNNAVWALGQLADKNSLPVLQKYYKCVIPAKESLDKGINQYELEKAIKWRQEGNLTSRMYKFIK